MTDDNEVEKVKLNNNSLADEIRFPRPSLVLDEFFSEPEEIFTGDSAGLREAAEIILRRRNPK
jgi:hypothetical protein